MHPSLIGIIFLSWPDMPELPDIVKNPGKTIVRGVIREIFKPIAEIVTLGISWILNINNIVKGGDVFIGLSEPPSHACTPASFLLCFVDKAWDYVWLPAGGRIPMLALLVLIIGIGFNGVREMLMFKSPEDSDKSILVGIMLILFWYPLFVMLINLVHGGVNTFLVSGGTGLITDTVTNMFTLSGPFAGISAILAVAVMLIGILIGFLPFIIMAILMQMRTVILGSFLIFGPILVGATYTDFPVLSSAADRILKVSVKFALLPLPMAPVVFLFDLLLSAGSFGPLPTALLISAFPWVLAVAVWVVFKTIAPSSAGAMGTVGALGGAGAMLGLGMSGGAAYATTRGGISAGAAKAIGEEMGGEGLGRLSNLGSPWGNSGGGRLGSIMQQASGAGSTSGSGNGNGGGRGGGPGGPGGPGGGGGPGGPGGPGGGGGSGGPGGPGGGGGPSGGPGGGKPYQNPATQSSASSQPRPRTQSSASSQPTTPTQSSASSQPRPRKQSSSSSSSSGGNTTSGSSGATTTQNAGNQPSFTPGWASDDDANDDDEDLRTTGASGTGQTKISGEGESSLATFAQQDSSTDVDEFDGEESDRNIKRERDSFDLGQGNRYRTQELREDIIEEVGEDALAPTDDKRSTEITLAADAPEDAVAMAQNEFETVKNDEVDVSKPAKLDDGELTRLKQNGEFEKEGKNIPEAKWAKAKIQAVGYNDWTQIYQGEKLADTDAYAKQARKELEGKEVGGRGSGGKGGKHQDDQIDPVEMGRMEVENQHDKRMLDFAARGEPDAVDAAMEDGYDIEQIDGRAVDQVITGDEEEKEQAAEWLRREGDSHDEDVYGDGYNNNEIQDAVYSSLRDSGWEEEEIDDKLEELDDVIDSGVDSGGSGGNNSGSGANNEPADFDTESVETSSQTPDPEGDTSSHTVEDTLEDEQDENGGFGDDRSAGDGQDTGNNMREIVEDAIEEYNPENEESDNDEFGDDGGGFSPSKPSVDGDGDDDDEGGFE